MASKSSRGTRCRQRVFRLDVDATFAGFRRRFGAKRQITCGEQTPLHFLLSHSSQGGRAARSSASFSFFFFQIKKKNIASLREQEKYIASFEARATLFLGDCHGLFQSPRNDNKRHFRHADRKSASFLLTCRSRYDNIILYKYNKTLNTEVNI